MTYYAREYTDPAGGALTITTDDAGVWITATDGIDEVTVGPFETLVDHTVTAAEVAATHRAAAEQARACGDSGRAHLHAWAADHAERTTTTKETR